MDLRTYWERTNAQANFERFPPDYYIRRKIEQYVPICREGQAIEIGCYPGSFLALFGDLGYTLHGIDTYPEVSGMYKTLNEQGYKTGEFENADFRSWQKKRRYDVVSSFGFIEHFEDYEQIIREHAELVSENGYIIVGAPNFSHGLQYWFHFLFDTPNLRRHVLDSMDPDKWGSILAKEGIEILYCNYCGGIQLWINNDQTFLQRLIGKLILKFLKLLKLLFFWINFENINSKWLSCYFLVIGKKHQRNKSL